MKNYIQGDARTFDRNWNLRSETFYTHWTDRDPVNQIQFAFRNHWMVFQELMKSTAYNGGKRVLEVGCGRGSLSCYFSASGYDCTLLDLSPKAIEIARQIFMQNNLPARFDIADAVHMPYENYSFDLVFSIGLLEHFNEIEPPLCEQVRVLAPGGLFIAYIVPHYSENIQKEFEWINEVIKGYANSTPMGSEPKEKVYRSDLGSERYLPILRKIGLERIGSSGVYPLPMISHSVDFPFTLMPASSEQALVGHFVQMLAARAQSTGLNPWLCPEGYGQAFLVWGVKA